MHNFIRPCKGIQRPLLRIYYMGHYRWRGSRGAQRRFRLNRRRARRQQHISQTILDRFWADLAAIEYASIQGAVQETNAIHISTSRKSKKSWLQMFCPSVSPTPAIAFFMHLGALRVTMWSRPSSTAGSSHGTRKKGRLHLCCFTHVYVHVAWLMVLPSLHFLHRVFDS